MVKNAPLSGALSFLGVECGGAWLMWQAIRCVTFAILTHTLFWNVSLFGENN